MARGKKKETLTPEERLQAALVPESEQPYKVPRNWCWMRGRAFLKPMETKRPEGEVFRYIDIDSIDNKRQQVTEPKNLQVKDAPSRASRKLRTGDTVFSMVRPYLMNIAYIDETISNSIASTGFYVCTPTENVNSLYLYYLMTSPYTVDGLNRYMKGDNSPSIRKDDIENYVYPIPPLPEQQRIVNRIESLFAKLDEAKQKAQDALDSFEPRKAAILHSAFTGELTAQWRKEHGVGMESWENLKIGTYAQVKGGKRLPKGHKLVTERTTHPYLRIADFGDGTINDSDLNYITEDTFSQIKNYIINKEDVYISIVGSIGKAGVIPESLNGANLTENAARIISSRTLPRYLSSFLSSPKAQNDIQNRIRSATLGKLSLLNIKDIETPVPSIEEQTEIVRFLDDLLAKEQQAKEAAEGVLEQIDLIKKAILARAFRGELGTNDPSEESAVELVKRAIERGEKA